MVRRRRGGKEEKHLEGARTSGRKPSPIFLLSGNKLVKDEDKTRHVSYSSQMAQSRQASTFTTRSGAGSTDPKVPCFPEFLSLRPEASG